MYQSETVLRGAGDREIGTEAEIAMNVVIS